MQGRIRVLFMILLVTGLILHSSGLAARGQSQTTLSVLPESGDLTLDEEIDLVLYITGGEDVNAFDVTISYDPDILHLESWSHGGYLANLYPMREVDLPGSLRLAFTQTNTPHQWGDGTLVNLVFRGVEKGFSAVRINQASLAGAPSGLVYPAKEDGSLIVHSDPDQIPAYPLSGSIGLQGRGDRGGITLDLGYGLQHWLGPYQATSSDLPGENLSFGAVYEDQYRLSVNVPGYLSLDPGLEKIKTVDSTHTTITPLILRGGNAVWQETVDGVTAPNQVIDEADLSLVTGQYREEGPGLTGDVNFDGRIDILDLALVAGNYELTAGAAYHDWLP